MVDKRRNETLRRKPLIIQITPSSWKIYVSTTRIRVLGMERIELKKMTGGGKA